MKSKIDQPCQHLLQAFVKKKTFEEPLKKFVGFCNLLKLEKDDYFP